MLERYETVTFRLAGLSVEDGAGIFDKTERGEDAAEGAAGGFRGEAADEELPQGGVTIGDGANGDENVEVAECCV